MTTQHLKTMLQDIINDRPEQAQAAMHEYFIAKSRELTEGLDSVKNSNKKWVYYKHPTKKGPEKNLNGDEAIDGVAYDEDSGIIQIADMPNFKPSYAELEKRGWRKMDSAQAEKAMGLNSDGQSLKESFVDGDFSNGTLSNVSKLPKTIMSNLDCRNNKIDSLRGIQKYVKTIKGTADFTNNPIKSHVLGLLEIDGLKSVMLDNKKVAAIINKHLKGDKDVIACQEELIEAGFEDFAQL